MPHNRFYIDSPLAPGIEVSLEGDEAHHLLHVMRKNTGEAVELVNGKNQLGLAQILRQDKKKVLLHVEQIEEKPSLPFKIILCQGMCRSHRLDTIVEKGTELGMDELWLFPGELSEKKELSETQYKRLVGITIAAMKQCGRLDLPKIVLKPPLAKWEKLAMPSFFGDPSPQAPFFLHLLQKMSEGILFFVGPESGFTLREEKLLQKLGAKGVQLHRNILRTETASLAALALISSSLHSA